MQLNDGQKMIRDNAQRIAEKIIAPRAEETDRKALFPRENLQELAKADFFRLLVPESDGGLGGGALSFVLAVEAIAQSCGSTALLFTTNSVVIKAISRAGTARQKEVWLPALMSGEKLGALAATEAASGCNPFATATKAIGSPAGFTVNGSKTFITASGEADIYVIVLKTGSAKSPADLSALVVEKGTPGFASGTREDMMGLRGGSIGELVFQDCRVPEANLLGPENGYLQVMPQFAGFVMLGCAAISLGIAQAAISRAVQHAKERVVASQPIGKFQGIQYLITEISASLAAARSLVYQTATDLDAGQLKSPVPLYIAKLHATETAIEIADKALQVHGGNGYSRELPLERYLRDARGLTLHYTPTEMLKSVAGQMIIGLPMG